MISSNTPDEQTRTSRAGWMLLLRTLVSVGMLGFLLQGVPRDELKTMWSGWDTRDLEWLGGAAGLTTLAIGLAALRWRRVLETLSHRPSLYRLVILNLAGHFVSNFLPTTVGGDVLRVRRLGRRLGDFPRCFASVVIERLTGWVVLPILSLSAFVINPGLGRLGAGSRTAIGMAIVTLVVLLLILSVAEHPRIGRRLEGTGNIRVTLSGLHLGLGEFRRQPRAVVNLVTVGVFYQLSLIAATAMAAEAVGIDVSPTAWLAFAPAVLIAQVLPLSIGGLGLREGALVLFLGPLGVSDADAILLGLILYAINLAVSLLGAPSFAYGWIRGYDKVVETPQSDRGDTNP
ncbi:MAG: flippase-like domain-containing protein [Actinomycetia bacterium]|nr:flippase-like domain-containing protein [Actinomycetes bacterium]MCP4960962.1 flippase-like domain-containing protein [Actinomycetes bacterium]